MLKPFSVSTFTVLCFCLLTSPAYASQVCVAWDPNDSYVNVRKSPNGEFLKKLENGTQIQVEGVKNDSKGRPWFDIVDRGSAGYTFIMKSLVRNCIPGSFAPDGRIVY